EAVDGDAGARLLALHAAAGRLARAGTDAAPEALLRMGGAFVVTQVIEFHRLSPRALSYFSSTTRTRGETAAIMPRTEGVSSSVRRSRILWRPGPPSVARCSFGRRIGLPICSTVTVLVAFLAMVMILWRRLLFSRDRVAAASLERRILDAALGSHILRMHLALQCVECRADHVVRVRRTHRLGDDVMHAERLENGAHRTAGDDAGAGLGRAQQNLARSVTACDVVMQRAARTQRHEDQVALGRLGRFTDGLRHFARLAVAEADATLLIADDDESGEAEATATLHHLGDAVDVDQL